jgi:hypothetical protein
MLISMELHVLLLDVSILPVFEEDEFFISHSSGLHFPNARPVSRNDYLIKSDGVFPDGLQAISEPR